MEADFEKRGVVEPWPALTRKAAEHLIVISFKLVQYHWQYSGPLIQLNQRVWSIQSPGHSLVQSLSSTNTSSRFIDKRLLVNKTMEQGSREVPRFIISLRRGIGPLKFFSHVEFAIL